MKKIYFIIAALLPLTLILTSCNTVNQSSSGLMMTPMPAVAVRENSIYDAGEKESTQENSKEDMGDSNESFEKLRQAALSLAPEGEGLAQQLFRKLVNYDENTIILARILTNLNAEPENCDEGETDLPPSVHIINIVAETYKLSGGELEEKGFAAVPILFTADEETKVLEKVYVPEIYDPQKRAEDIKKIFGVDSEEDLGLAYDESLYAEYKSNLAETKYQIALAGGFSGFRNTAAKMLELLDREFENASEVENAIRDYFVRSTFSYNSFTVPIWHELGREEKDIWVKLYTVMYFGEIRTVQGGEPEKGIYSVPVVAEAKFVDDAWHVKMPIIIIDAEGQALIDGVKENFGEYTDDCMNFSGTQEAGEMVQELERIQQSLIDGAFEAGE